VADVEIFDPRFESVVGHHELVQLVANGFSFIEGPVWQADKEVLIFNDIPEARTYTYSPRTGQVDIHRFANNNSNGQVFDAEHRLVICQHATSRVVREESDGSLTVLASTYDGAELNSPNDVIIDRHGRVLFTDPPFGRMVGNPTAIPRPLALAFNGVFRVDPTSGNVTALAEDYDRPNGLCFNSDETILYVNDSARMHIRRYEIDGDNLVGGEVFADVRGPGPGAPDGMKVDSQDNVWCTGPGGVHVYDPTGRKLGVLHVPEETCNLEWGGCDRRTVFLTASSSLYCFRSHVPGPDRW
jgi:gluconolactonase